jgi:hypothetical protein
MLWQKSWLETRWRFLIGLALLMLSAGSTVLTYPQVMKLLPLVKDVDVSGEIGRRVMEQAELMRTYRGYVWSQWFRQNGPQLWILFAALLGTGGLLSQTSGGGTLFTLSLPVTRNRLLGVRAATGLVELVALAMIPSLWISLLSPAVGQSYGLVDALVHGVCLFITGSMFFSLTFLFSTLFSDVWRPPLIALCVAFVLGLADRFVPDFSRFGCLRIMSAEVFFRHGELPWLGLIITGAVSAVLLYAAIRNVARRDF